MTRLVIDLTPLKSPGFIRALKERLGMLLRAQSHTRLMKGGDDELTFAPLKFPRPDGSQNNPLMHTGKHLDDHLEYGHDATGVWVKTEGPGAAVQQEGTVGASAAGVGAGKRPTIKPVYAKALFIPLTMKAEDLTSRQRSGASDTVMGVQAERERLKELQGRARKDKRNADAIAKQEARVAEAVANRKALGLIWGVDYVWASKVDIPPRPFLRISAGNAKEIAQVVEGKRGTP